MGYAELGGGGDNYKLQVGGGSGHAQEMPTDYHNDWQGKHNANHGQVNDHGQPVTAGQGPAELA